MTRRRRRSRRPTPGIAAGLALALLAGAAGPGAAQDDAREEILSYDVRVEVSDGGVLRVTEEIEVRALGDEIRRGIYRDFPTTFPREEGFGRIEAPFEVIAVRRDGNAERYRLMSVGGPAGRSGVRVRIGREEVFLDDGVYRYTLVYETSRWVRFGEDEARLYWNVTGNGWGFPILSASAEVTFPSSPPEGQVRLEAWTGPEGSRASAATAEWDADAGVARFRTTEALAPREGLTVRVTVPAGVVAPPTEAQREEWFRLDWGGYVDAGLVVALILALYLFMWVRVGRDPASGAIVVRYEPPEGFSPAALGYVRERGFDPAQLTAALVSLAVRGAVEIDRDGDDWIVRDTGDLPDGVSGDEETLHAELLGDGRALALTGSPNSELREGVKAFKKRLERTLEKTYFLNNRSWFAAGAAASAMGFGALAWRARFDVSPEAWFMGFWLTFWTMGVGTLLYRVFVTWKRALTGSILSGVGAVFLSLFSVPFVAAELFVGAMLYQRVPLHLLAAAVVLGAVNVLFYHLLERPTLKGRGVLDRLEGFRRFLGATEKDRMDRLQPPDESLELFERFLPYAIALEVENEWARRFEDALTSRAAAASASGSTLAWYHADGGGTDLGGMTSALGGAFSSSLSASSAAPSSSGGGGGSSGGGGGGGGGGGW